MLRAALRRTPPCDGNMDPTSPLRDALAHSPDNVPLRRLLAAALLQHGRFDEAEREYRDALRRAPNDVESSLGLTRAFLEQRKFSPALVVIEGLLQRDDPPALAFLLHARVLADQGDLAQAARQYRRALDADPDVADATLALRLQAQPAHDGAESVDPSGTSDSERSAFQAPDETTRLRAFRPDVDFRHVGGMEALKDQIRMKIIHPLTKPDLYRAYGKKVGGGVLLYGPPGCGKTHLARATAGEVKATFLSVGIHDVLDMWIGRSERNLHAIFEQAREQRPCVLFFDEVDALGANRTDMRTHAGRQLINQFLSELDGVEADNDGVLVLAATNAPWHLDPAFRRPGRFDRTIFVPPPDATARAAILTILLDGKPQERIDVDTVAKKTDAWSGADLKGLVDRAVEAKLGEAMRTGVPAPLSTKDLLAAAKQGAPTVKEWFLTARNYVLFANEAGLYDELRPWLPR